VNRTPWLAKNLEGDSILISSKSDTKPGSRRLYLDREIEQAGDWKNAGQQPLFTARFRGAGKGSL